jgi:uncharacterized membrane protein
MLKANKKTLIITSIITILPIFVGVYFWNRLPDVMATHFGVDNTANGFSSKPFAVFGLPLFCLAIEWVAAFVTSHDPRRKNISPKMFTLVLWIVPIISMFCAVIMYPANLGYELDITLFAEIFMGLLFVIIGNFLPKARQNYTIGIRLPWTLANEENWNRTHRIAGYLWLISGILVVALTLCKVLNPGLMIVIIAVIVIVPFFYSFWLHVRKAL